MHTWVDCYLFVKNVSVTDHKPSNFVIRAQIQTLRLAANHAIREKMIIFSDFDIPAYHDADFKYSARPDRDPTFNHTIWSDFYSFSQHSVLVNNCAWMYV
jgi:hypothetical protein